MRLLTQPYLLTLEPASEMNILWIQPEQTEAFVEFGYTEALEKTESSSVVFDSYQIADEDGNSVPPA